MEFQQRCPLGPTPLFLCGGFFYTGYQALRATYNLGFCKNGVYAKERHLWRFLIAGSGLALFSWHFGKSYSRTYLSIGVAGLIILNINEAEKRQQGSNKKYPLKMLEACTVITDICTCILGLNLFHFVDLDIGKRQTIILSLLGASAATSSYLRRYRA
jgi:hypothetical protein